jgi:hypothetical protein
MKHLRQLLVVVVAIAAISGVSALTATATTTAQATHHQAGAADSEAWPRAFTSTVPAPPIIVFGAWMFAQDIGYGGNCNSCNTYIYTVCLQFNAGVWGWVTDSAYGQVFNDWGTACNTNDAAGGKPDWQGAVGNCITGVNAQYRTVYVESAPWPDTPHIYVDPLYTWQVC